MKHIMLVSVARSAVIIGPNWVNNLLFSFSGLDVHGNSFPTGLRNC